MPSKSKVYSPTSPALHSTIDRHHLSSNLLPTNIDNQQALYYHHSGTLNRSSKSFNSIQDSSQHQASGQCTSQCLRFRYFTIFLLCTTCLMLLSGSLATHKWIISRPIRMLKLNNSQTNWASLMLLASQNESPATSNNIINKNTHLNGNNQMNRAISASLSLPQNDRNNHQNINPNSLSALIENSNSDNDKSLTFISGNSDPNVDQAIEKSQSITGSQNKKFQGEIYFGLFRGLKILNHGFGDRHTLISGKQQSDY